VTSRSFEFKHNDERCWVQAHPNKHPTVTLALPGGAFPSYVNVSVSMTPAEARAMAVALEAAATHAEAVIAETGLGESAVDA